MDLPEEAKQAPSAPVWNQSFPSPNFFTVPSRFSGRDSDLEAFSHNPSDGSVKFFLKKNNTCIELAYSLYTDNRLMKKEIGVNK